MNILLQVDEIYTVPEVGTVVGGTLYRSVYGYAFFTIIHSACIIRFVWHGLSLSRCSLCLCSGICREGDHLVVGPTDLGQFHKLTIGSIQRNRSACRVLRAGQAATLALGNFDRSLLRKVRLLYLWDACNNNKRTF